MMIIMDETIKHIISEISKYAQGNPLGILQEIEV